MGTIDYNIKEYFRAGCNSRSAVDPANRMVEPVRFWWRQLKSGWKKFFFMFAWSVVLFFTRRKL